MRNLLFIGLASLLFALPSACVSKRKYNEEVRLRREVEDRNLQYTAEVRAVGKRSDAINATIADLERELAETRADGAARVADLERQLSAQRQRSSAQDVRAGQRIETLTAELETARAHLARIDAAYAGRQQRMDALYRQLTSTLTGYDPDELRVVKDADGPRVEIATGTLFRSGNYERVRTDGRRVLTAIAFALQKDREEELRIQGVDPQLSRAQRAAAGTGTYLRQELSWPAGQLVYSARQPNVVLPAENEPTAVGSLPVPHVRLQVFVPPVRAAQLR